MDLIEALSLLETQGWLNESKAEIQTFIDKFGQDNYDLFINLKDRLKNKGKSANIMDYIGKKSSITTPEEMSEFLGGFVKERQQRDHKDEYPLNLDEIKAGNINGKFKYYGRMGNYEVYEPQDIYSAMELGVGTIWCTSGRYTDGGKDEDFIPSISATKKHLMDDGINHGVRFLYLLDPATMHGKIAIALYPQRVPVRMTVPTRNQVIFLDSTNFEIFDEDDNNEFSLIEKLPKGFIDKFGLEVSYNTIADKNEIPVVNKDQIEEITILSTSQARELPQNLLKYFTQWWLKDDEHEANNGYYGYYNEDAPIVTRYFSIGSESVTNEQTAARPALKCRDIDRMDLQEGDYVSCIGNTWYYIGNNWLLLMDSPPRVMPFNKSEMDGNSYAGSDLKKFLDNWF